MTAGYSEPSPDNTPDNTPEPIIPEPLASTADNQINNMWESLLDDLDNVDEDTDGIVVILRAFMESQVLDVNRFGWGSVFIDYWDSAELYHEGGVPTFIHLEPTQVSTPVLLDGWTEKQCKLCGMWTNVFVRPGQTTYENHDPFDFPAWGHLQNPCQEFQHLGLDEPNCICNDCWGSTKCDICQCQAPSNTETFWNNRCQLHQRGPDGGGRKKKRKTKRKRKKRKKMHNSRTNQTRKIRGGGANDQWGKPITKRWYNMKITKQDHPTIFRIAALAHAGFSWPKIQRLLDGYHPDTGKKDYSFQLVNLDRVSFNSLLSGGTHALAIREGNDAYNKHMADLQSQEPTRWDRAVDEYKKRLFREEQRLKRKRADALAKSGRAVGDTTDERLENAIIRERNEQAGRIQQKIAENRSKYTKAEPDDKVYCINCGNPFHKGCMKAVRETQNSDECPMCRQDLFKIKELQMSEEWFVNAKRWTPAVKREPAKKKEDEEGCPICLLSWGECDLNVGKWGDYIIVEREPRLQRWLMRWRQRARDARQRLRNTRCAVMGGKRNKKKKRKQKTRKKKRKKRKRKTRK